MFFTSVFVPSVDAPCGRTLMFASTRSDPSSMLTSLTSAYSSICLSTRRYAPASAADRMSGSLTISTSGTPDRLRSIAVTPGYRSWMDLPASSSMWRRVMPTTRLPAFTAPPVASGLSNCEI